MIGYSCVQDKIDSSLTLCAQSQLDRQQKTKSAAENVAKTLTTSGPKQQQQSSSSDTVVNATTATSSQPKTVTDTEQRTGGEQNSNIPQRDPAEKVSSDTSSKEVPCAATDVNLVESNTPRSAEQTARIAELDSVNAPSTTLTTLPPGKKVKKKKKKMAVRLVEDIIRYSSPKKEISTIGFLGDSCLFLSVRTSIP